MFHNQNYMKIPSQKTHLATTQFLIDPEIKSVHKYFIQTTQNQNTNKFQNKPKSFSFQSKRKISNKNLEFYDRGKCLK